APGEISTTSDMWSIQTTKEGIMGITAHWIEVNDSGWSLRAEAIACKSVPGAHTGQNLARFFWASCNNTLASYLEEFVSRRTQSTWDSDEKRIPCLAHVANLAVVAVMEYVTKVGVAENATLIWEYDPTDPANRVLGGKLDVIAVIRTLTVKIQASSQRIEYFFMVQIEVGINPAQKIPLHSAI
ncbi:hypothetical protein SISSUDRAFT_967285, partial [Sistotremastrum suecicum HHB10207 ss-3]